MAAAVEVRSNSRYSCDSSCEAVTNSSGMHLGDDRLHPLLVRRVAVGVQEQDGDRLRTLRHRLRDHRAHLRLVERDEHLALRVHALADFETQVAVDQRLVPLEEEIVGFRPVDAADLVDVAKALRCDERAARAGALQDGVDRDRGAVQEQPRGAERCAGLGDAVLDAVDQPRRRGERLAELQLAGRLVEGGDIRERAADVSGQPNLLTLQHAQAIAPWGKSLCARR